jgi:hypothetical protein
MASALFDKAEREILDFHRFFVAWYDAATAANTDFARCEAAFGAGFRMTPPTGKTFDRNETIEIIRANRASFDRDFAIEIEAIEPIWEGEGVIAVAYIERQGRRGAKTARRATALFTENPSAPNAVEWRLLHETWMQAVED